MEESDRTATIQLFSSVAGGTGSGLGTRLTEAAREEYPKSTIANFVRGEKGLAFLFALLKCL